jgi:SNF2 family DNA or RNA helicase
MSWLLAWQPYFSPKMRMTGRAHQTNNRVQRVPVENGTLAQFVITDEQSETFEVELAPGGSGNRVAVGCTCDECQEAGMCEHIYGALVELAEYPEGRDDDHARIENIRPSSPKARKRERSKINIITRTEPVWATRLSHLRVGSLAGNAANLSHLPVQRQVCYILQPEVSFRHNSAVVELRFRQPTRDGWSAPKQFKISEQIIHTLTEPEDKQLCSLLMGGSHPVEDDWSSRSTSRAIARSQCIFVLPQGGRQLLMARMIQTGRCFMAVDSNNLEPLTWDSDDPDVMQTSTTRPPWALWLVGNLSEDEQKVGFELELRRQGHSMPADKPALILSGHDGIVVYDNKVAPFFDHGASQWINQYRDELGRHESVEQLEVPMDDLPRFLDRLYKLPQIPEVDLPDDVGWTEQRIRPEQNIEIFSPAATTENTKQLKGTLTARPWFAYGNARVNPSQPGRFVTDSPAPPPPAPEPDDSETDESSVETTDEQVNIENVDQTDVTLADTQATESESQDDTVAQEDDTVAQEIVDDNDDEAGDTLTSQNLVRRDIQFEHDCLAWLLTVGMKQNPSNPGELLSFPAKNLPHIVSELLAHGWGVTADQRVVRQSGPARLSVSSGIDWFELRGTVKFETDNGTEEIALPQLLAAARTGRTMIQLSDGSHGLLPDEWLAEHGLLTTIGELQDDHLRFKTNQAAILDGLLRKQELVSVDENFAQARQRLREFEGIKPITPTDNFNGQLRPYQSEALGWFDFLRQFGMGGILADDMGLGKTVQVLALLASRVWLRKQQEQTNGVPKQPVLIVAPRSVVFNWIDEAERFTPELKVLAYAGNEREKLREQFKDHDLIVTSFGLMRRDIAELRNCPFDYVVLDEAQAIKNPSSQSAKAARLLNTQHRLALTGTPVENHLGDLWSIFEFLNPGFLGSSLRFGQLVRGDIGSKASAKPTMNNRGVEKPKTNVANQIADALRPFILRRTKKQVLKDLPDKTEQTIVCEMEPQQRKLYDELRLHYRNSLLGTKSSLPSDGSEGTVPATGGGSAMMVLEALLRLRQASCHPGLIDPNRRGEPSAKLEALIEMVLELAEEGHKALIFSQFVEMLSIVRSRLEEHGVVYEYLDGQTRDRKRRVQRFQDDPDCPVFLISLKAGGLGLNLTAAEYVFILDPWWNPAVEQQAIDRTHRIGQTRHVFAYRMICQNTVEQRIAELQDRKRQLADAIVGGDQSPLRNLSREDLERLLS